MSKRESRIAASEARAAWPPDSAVGLQVQQRDVEPEVAQDGLRARVEIGAAELQPASKRLGVVVPAAVCQRSAACVHQRLRRRDAGAPREVVLQPLAGRAVGLLREIAGGSAVSVTLPPSG